MLKKKLLVQLCVQFARLNCCEEKIQIQTTADIHHNFILNIYINFIKYLPNLFAMF